MEIVSNQDIQKLEVQVKDFCNKCSEIKQKLFLKEEKESSEVRSPSGTNRAVRIE